MLNTDTLYALIREFRDDVDMTDFLEEALLDFEAYHKAIYEMESKLLIRTFDNMDTEQRKDLETHLDQTRTRLHNKLLSDITVLNRLAEQKGLPPVYDGVVSEERPYRRQVADAVLAFVEQTVRDRR